MPNDALSELVQMSKRIEELDAEREVMKREMALRGENRCWLSGGLSCGDDDPTVIKIYGALSPAQKAEIFALCRAINETAPHRAA